MIWFKWDTTLIYSHLDGVIKVNDSNIDSYSHLIKESIDLFNSTILWDGMYTLNQGINRITQDKETCFILTHNNEVLGHTWFGNMWWYNLFVHPKRPSGITLDFCMHCFYNINQTSFYAWTGYWNTKAVNLCIRTGGKMLHPLSRF